MEENKICKCCCSESGGGRFVHLMLDGEGSRQSNQSLRILVNTFRTILEKDTDSSRNPIITPQNWLRQGGRENGETSGGGYRTWNGQDCLAASVPHASPNKMSAKVHPSPHRRQDASEFQLAVKSPRIRGHEALGFVLHWNHRAETRPTPSQRRNTFNHSMSSRFLTLLCVGSRDSCHTSCVWEWAYGWQKEDEKEAYQGLAMGAKMEGIMESLTQSSLRGKICAKKRI